MLDTARAGTPRRRVPRARGRRIDPALGGDARSRRGRVVELADAARRRAAAPRRRARSPARVSKKCDTELAGVADGATAPASTSTDPQSPPNDRGPSRRGRDRRRRPTADTASLICREPVGCSTRRVHSGIVPDARGGFARLTGAPRRSAAERPTQLPSGQTTVPDPGAPHRREHRYRPPPCRPARREARAVRGRAARRRRRDPPRRRDRPARAARRRSPTPTRCSSARPPRSTPRRWRPPPGSRSSPGPGSGLDNVDVPAATARGVMVVNAPTSNIVSAAEHAVALLLATARHIPAADASLRSRAVEAQRVHRCRAQRQDRRRRRPRQDRPARRAAPRRVRRPADRLRPLRRARPRRPARHRAGEPGRAAPPRRHDLDPPAQDPRDPRPHRQGPAGADQARRADRQRRPRRPDRRGRAGRGRAQRARRRAPASTSTSPSRPPSSPLFELPQVVVTPHLGASTDEAQDRAGTDVARSVQLALAGEFVPDAVNVQVSGVVGEEVRPWLPLTQKLGTVLHALAGRVPSSVTVEVSRRAGRRGRLGAAAGRAARAVHPRGRRAGHVRERAGARRRARGRRRADHRAGERQLPQRRAAARRDARRRGDHRVRHADRPVPGAEAGGGQRPALRPARRGRGHACSSTPTGPA